MSSGPEISRAARVAGIVLAALGLLVWLIVAAQVSSLGTSDPAGNAMAAGFAGVGIILLWLLLSILALIAATKGGMPAWARPALLLVPASGLAAIVALELLSRPSIAPWHWPLIVPVLVPPLVVAYCLWSLLRPPLTAFRAAALLGAIAILSAAIAPLYAMREATIAQQQTTRVNQRAALAQLPADSPLWAFTPFLDAEDQTIASDAFARIQTLERRQADAEAMLAQGDFPLAHLPRLGLDVTPALCDNARALLRKRVEPLVLGAPGSKPYSDVAREVSAAHAAMSFLVGDGCACDTEARAWEDMAKTYRDTNYDVVLLAGLRDPGQLGRKLREDPDRFSQLGPQSHLKAWLKFTDDAATRERVIEGARKLDHRTTDAIEILTDKYQESVRFRLFRVMPMIDLDATPALCMAAANVLGRGIAGTYRPKADDPRPYSELLDRMGVGQPLHALVWLGEHGCAMPGIVDDAETLVRSYQDSRGRAEMLAALAKLREK
jgi:hypothetical protein